MRSNPSQLWVEEVKIFTRLASGIPQNGTIVELGTAWGGSALLLHRATKRKKISIYSCDIAPSPRAFVNLRGTGVHIIKKPSLKFAREWPKKVGRQIDLLFIDANHSFESVFEDFNLWVKHMKPNGLVIFHDYDPPQRGGLAHFGIRVCLDALVRSHVLRDPIHVYKLLYGRVISPQSAKIKLGDCYRVFERIRKDILSVRKRIFKRSYNAGLGVIKNRSIRMDSVGACYALDYLLKKDFELVCRRAVRPEEVLRWGELLWMLEHGYGPSRFPDNRVPFGETPRGLSKGIAREQVRLRILAQILQAVVSWKP